MLNKPSLAVVDSYFLLRVAIGQVLETLGFCVSILANDDKDFNEQVEHVASVPDVCLLDIDTPSLREFKVAKRIKERYPGIKIIAYTVYEKEFKKIDEYGVDIFLKKDCSPEEIKAKIIRLMEPVKIF